MGQASWLDKRSDSLSPVIAATYPKSTGQKRNMISLRAGHETATIVETLIALVITS